MTSYGFGRVARACLRRFLLDRSGATAIEYGLMAALIGIAIMTTVFSTGQGIKNTLYGQITNALGSMTK